jgi:branched-chain amino acid transport system ATP-binding protein
LHVPEGRGIFPDLTVFENLKLGLFADPKQSSAEFGSRLERVFGYFPILKERLKQDSGTLSGGEQQMLAIGRALMASPRLLMLDEPSLGLSPLYSQQVLDNLRRIADDGETSVLLIEQNARAALERTDRAYVLSRGVAVLEGTAAQLLAEHDLSELYLAVEA